MAIVYLCGMYGKAEASRLRQEFWTTFGQYMQPIPDAEGDKCNWVNYKTGYKDLFFKMNATQKMASIAIEMTHIDVDIQQMFFEQFEQLKHMLENELAETWTWAMHQEDEHGKVISRIYTEIHGVNVFDRNDWPRLISFFKPRMLALDRFWSIAKLGFEELR
jgi:hypothetical protein